MRELTAQGMTLPEAYSQASVTLAPQSSVVAAQSSAQSEPASTSQAPMDSHSNAQAEGESGECEYMVLKRAFPFRMVPVCVDEQTWEKNPARRVPVKPHQ